MDEWSKLSMADRAKYIKLAVDSGLTDLSHIKTTYNSFARGGYTKWKERIKKHKGLDIDNDPTYDYEGFYNSNPDRAWDMLKKKSEEHFVDDFKTSLHPSFSNESQYSGYKNKYNPEGITGGTWIDDYNYQLSESQFNNDWDTDNTLNYFEENEEHPVRLYAPDGSTMLRSVTVTPQSSKFNKNALGGKVNKFDGTGDSTIERQQSYLRPAHDFSDVFYKTRYGDDYGFYDKDGNSIPYSEYEGNIRVDQYGIPIDVNDLGNYDTSERLDYTDHVRQVNKSHIMDNPQLAIDDRRMIEKANADEWVRENSPDEMLKKFINWGKNSITGTKYFFQGFTGTPPIFLDLNDKYLKNVSNTNRVEAVLTNDFVEHNPNTVRPAKDFKITTDTLLGDRRIPLSNISQFYGIEDGKLKIGDLNAFNDETIVMPVRNKNIGKFKEIKKITDSYPDYTEEAVERYPSPSLLRRIFSPSTIIAHNRKVRNYKNQLYLDNYPTNNYFTTTHLVGITENGDTIDLPNYMKDKLLFSNSDGVSYFINKLEDDKVRNALNEVLNKTPLYPILPDNGRYRHYDLNGDVNGYVNPLDNRKDMFILGY